ncbi:MAG: efflux RND transporter periplasmic adaptor subunit [Acidobacteriota bacterium]
MHRILSLRTVLLTLPLLAGAIYLTADPPTRDASPRATMKRVEVAEVGDATDRRALRFAGVTRAARRARLAFALGGRVVERPVEIGDEVARGAVVARVDDRELRNAVDTAAATVTDLEVRRRQLERDLERARALVEVKAATPEELEKTQAALESTQANEMASKARLREARRLLDEATLRAPFAGTVTEVLLEPGEYTTPGRSVLELSGSGPTEVEVEVPETVVPRIAEGDIVQVFIARLGTEVDAPVRRVGRATGGPGQLFPVVVDLPADLDIAPGLTAELVLTLESSGALTVPVEAVINPGGRRPSLFRLVDGERVERVFVEVGTLLADRVVVHDTSVPAEARSEQGAATEAAGREALAVGDLVVVGGQRGLLDGEHVETVSRDGGV